MSHVLRVFRSLKGSSYLLALFLLIPPSVFGVSPVFAASHPSAPFPRTPSVGAAVSPVRTSTQTSPHRANRSSSRLPPIPLAPVTSAQPAPSSGATVLKPPVQSGGGLRPNTVTASPSFSGQQGSLLGGQDPSADAGRDNIMEVVDNSFAIYDRSGNLQYSQDLNSWFGTNYLTGGDVIFDPWNERFAFISMDHYNFIRIGVAQQTDALGSYCNYAFSLANWASQSAGIIVSNQAVGFDETYLYITAEAFNSGTISYSIIWQINLKQMEACSSVSTWTWDHMTDPNGQPAEGIVPAMKYSYAVAHDEEYLVSPPNLGGACSITLWRITNHVLYNAAVTTECYSTPPWASQPGSPGSLQTRPAGELFHQATYINGLLDFALVTGYNWGNGNVTSAIAWVKIAPESATLSQQGYIGSPSYWYFNPAMAQDRNGQSVMVFDVSSTFLTPAVWYVAQNADGSQQNTLSLISGAGNTSTLGDYQSARLDPVDEVHIWICGSYSQGTAGWGSQIAQTAAS